MALGTDPGPARPSSHPGARGLMGFAEMAGS